MPDDSELETKDLQEAIDDLHEREAEEKKSGWTRYVGLSTAILAVFAAVGALQSGSLVNEALINQVKSSDTWNEYQASREKSHLYTIMTNGLVDRAPSVASPVGSAKPKRRLPKGFKPEAADQRIQDYADQINKEDAKSKSLSKKAAALEKETDHQLRHHHNFAYSVALIQVAIALGAVSALTKVKSVWFFSMACGAIGVVLFVLGFIG